MLDPEHGTLLGTGWFRDERGLNHQAMVCLSCGTVHATTGAPLKGLLTLGSRMASVKFYMPPDRLQGLVDEKGPDSLTHELGLQPIVIDQLVSRGFLKMVDS